ncbi:MAG: tryptophan synthase beta chain [Alphaproteobacteria bacterium]|nr:MAG: tryptophan synthase beta chain [Alphaproteobacteria bacterium]
MDNKKINFNSLKNQPSEDGKFGEYGGMFVAETLMPLILSLSKNYNKLKKSSSFQEKLKYYQKNYIGRPSPLYFASRITDHCGGAKVFFKRDELNHTGAHKINNVIGQALLAKEMGKNKIIAETGAGQHGVATATVCALFDMDCEVFMGEEDIERQKPNVERMQLLGAKIIPVSSGTGTLKDAMNEALRHWVSNAKSHFYIIGTVAGPHPYPMMVRDFQSIIGEEAKEQILEIENRLPSKIIACIGGGSNAMGLFHSFLDDDKVEIIGVEAGGKGINSKLHAASLTGGKPGILHGNKTYLLQDFDGQIIDAHSISAGLDYPGIGPEHSWLNDIGRVQYKACTDNEALEAFHLCSKLEGIIPALEPAHALHITIQEAKKMKKDDVIIMNMCGRGDKDLSAVLPKLKAMGKI